MKTRDFDYELPQELIAQEPAPERTAARMLVVHRDTGELEHSRVAAIGDYLKHGDLLVVNNTRVIPARLSGRKEGTGGAVELLLLEPLTGDVWQTLCRSSRQPKAGMRLQLAGGRIRGEVLAQDEGGRLKVRLKADGPFDEVLEQVGEIPLPPYIRRTSGDARRRTDAERYQTVYASQRGAIAAPTAGLHFTPALLAQLAADGIGKAEITLHVGIGTFRPVSTEDVHTHRMDEERYEISPGTADAINTVRRQGGRVAAVGSTSARTLETAVRRDGRMAAGAGRSDLFIYPPYAFRAVDVMLTNFHLPRSTLLMMVSALAGLELMREAYRTAVAARYRFYSYGDCMLIL